ncbi:MAG: hypothetical protein EAZ78_13680 [Oscillatoriales cyanobacterium]|nr:MAG: hypothetical protein EA000_23750 [Oscillatoriales cyanobacterium]TAD94550.1 MAG: hypothetical protein EAZ98_18935 [Oscillatoriales cyanobacterium]TAD96204.1 MAG: hypothetical protein EAZ96_26185 [Oscillatoriales cyanobacterium]TAF03051.1 MAG: hypothetical protein EAZ78_13680 [Oscillatoriales cyanobacterium]TAF61067.1 MAG: hypothetical protein EAZ59_25850 [Oscillatoriales cyanobacterium]
MVALRTARVGTGALPLQVLMNHLGLLYDRSGQQSVRELADKLTQLLYFSAIVFRLYGRLAARFLPSPRSCDRDGSKSSYSYPTFGILNYAS